MNIFNVRTYGLDESIIASGYPMQAEVKNMFDIKEHVNLSKNDNPNVKRAVKLGNTNSGEGHDCWLKGVIVQFDMKAPEYFWRQFDRYHFHDYVSSQSKMHMIRKMDLDKMCNGDVTIENVENLKQIIEDAWDIDTIMSNTPMGFELTARITSNYLQEKTIYKQRHNHRSHQWRQYCEWLTTLPMFNELCLGSKTNDV